MRWLGVEIRVSLPFLGLATIVVCELQTVTSKNGEVWKCSGNAVPAPKKLLEKGFCLGVRCCCCTFHRLQGVLCQCDSLGELYAWLSQLLPV